MKRKFEFVDQMSEDFSLGPIEGMKRFCAALETERMSAAEVEAGFLQDSVTSRFQVDVFWTLHLAGLLSFAKYCGTTSGKKNISDFLRLTLSERDESSLVACLGSEILSYLITEVPEEGSNILVASMFITNEAVLSSEWAPEDILYCEILLRRLQDFDSTLQTPNRFPKTVFYGAVLNKLVALPLDSSNNAALVAWRSVASLCFEFFAIYLNHHLRDSESILMDYSSARPSCELVFSVFLAEAARSSTFSEVLDIIRGVWAVAVSEQSSHLIGRCLWLLEAIVVVCNSCGKASINEIFLVVDGLLVKACDDQNDSDKAKVLEFTLLAMCEYSSFQSEPFLNLLCRVVRQRREKYKETADIFLGSARARLKQFEALRTGGIENISEPSVAPTTPSIDSASVQRSELDKSVNQLELSGERVASWAATVRRTTYLPGVVSQLCTQHSSSGFLRGLEFLAKRDKKIRSQCIEIVTAMAKQAPPLCSEVEMNLFCGAFSSVLPATLSSQPCEALGALEELFLSGKRSDLYPKSEVSHALQYLAKLLEAVEKRLLLTVEAVDLLLSSWSLKCGIIRKGLSSEETREFLVGFYFVVQQLLVKCQSAGVVDSFVWSWWTLVYRIIESLIKCFGCDGLESVIMESITSESLEPHDFLSIGSMLLLLPEKVSWQFAETAVAKINTSKAKNSLSKLRIIVQTALKHSLLRDSDLPGCLRTSSVPMVYLFVWCSHQLNETFATETDDLMLEVLMSALGCSSCVCSTSELAVFLGSRPMSAICNWEKHCGGSIAKEELSFQRVLDYSCRIWRSNALDRNSFEKDRLLPMGLLVSQLTEKLGNILSDSTTLKNQVIADGIAKFSIQRLCFSSENADKQDTNVTLFFRELYERYFDTGEMQKKAHPSESVGIAKITETYLRMKSCDSSLSAALATLCSPFLCDPKILQSVPSLLYKDYLSSSESVAVSAAAIICSLKREILKCSSKELMVSQQELVASIAQAYRRVSPANTSFTAEVIRWAILDSIRRLREDSEKTENHGIVLSRAISGDVKIASPSAPGGVLTVTLTVLSVRTLGWAFSLLFALSDQVSLSEIKLLEIVTGSPINVSGAHLESYVPQSQCSVWLLLMLTGALSALSVLGTGLGTGLGSISVKLKRLLFNWLAMLLNSSSSELLSELKTLQTTDTINRDLQSNSSASKDSKFAENICQVLILKTSTESKISSLIELEVLSQFPSFVATSNWKI